MSDTIQILPTGPMYTSRQVAEALGVHPVTIRKLVTSGKAECTRVLSRVYFTEEQARALVHIEPAKPKS